MLGMSDEGTLDGSRLRINLLKEMPIFWDHGYQLRLEPFQIKGDSEIRQPNVTYVFG